MLANRYGHFDNSGRAFRITDPQTPAPWTNVVCNGRYGFVVSQSGGGFSWYDDAQHNVLTRWEMDLVRDCHGKFLYLRDLESGELWTAAPAPLRPSYTSYSCVHEPGVTTFRTTYAGIAATWTMTVAPDDAAEIWTVELRNEGPRPRPRKLRIAAVFDWCCGVAPDVKREFHKLFLQTEHDAGRRAIIATKNMWDIPPKSERDHWNQPWPYTAALAVGGIAFERDLAIGDRTAWLGRYGSTSAPAALTADKPAVTGFGRFGDGAAGLGGDLTIPAGGSVTLHYVLAIAADRARLNTLLDRYQSPAEAKGAVEAARRRWDSLLSPTRVTSSLPDFDLLNNTWLAYQAISGRLWGRTGYYQQSGGIGFRDQLQDSQVWLTLEPARCRDQILLHATRQFSDGSVNHWWHALADFGNRTACSDDYLWLPFITAQYIKETGDEAILDRKVAFKDGGDGTILDHCRRSMKRAFGRFSPRGLPLIGSCDWNDGLSALGIGEKGESVWLGFFLCMILEDWRVLLTKLGDEPGAADCQRRRAGLVAAINQHAWDGEYFRYGTKDSGEWIGASACAEGKIHLNAQTWSILSEATTPERQLSAWKQVKDKLIMPYGPLLLAPAYSIPDPDIGYITRYSPGSRENGGVYMHAATWALMAACKVKDIETVRRIWKSVSPPVRGQDADSYRAEPYVTPGNVDGPLSETPGRAGWTWYTGSAGWLRKVSLDWVLGVRAGWDGLTIDPAPPAELGEVEVVRPWRDVRVRVMFDAREYRPGVRARLIVNGTAVEGNVLKASTLEPGEVVHVQVRWDDDSKAGPPRSAEPAAIARRE
ncbi:MAG: glycosyl transferase family 36 [Phycisphaerales bacterium]|nr:glycosyl transferase family 36 [Phycisphaerales bacterium]